MVGGIWLLGMRFKILNLLSPHMPPVSMEGFTALKKKGLLARSANHATMMTKGILAAQSGQYSQFDHVIQNFLMAEFLNFSIYWRESPIPNFLISQYHTNLTLSPTRILPPFTTRQQIPPWPRMAL